MEAEGLYYSYTHLELFLSLANNEYGVGGAASRYEIKLYVNDKHLLS